MPSQESITQLLLESKAGDSRALDRLMPLVYDELRRIANHYLRDERADHTLQPTALVHEAYIRLIDQHSVDWQNRAQFFALAAQMMRRILVNHAEAHRAQRRGGGARKVSLDEAISFFEEQNINLLALNEALERLEQLSPLQSRIVELRFFGGLTVEEIAEVLGVSEMTVKRHWRVAKTWLYKEVLSDEY